MTVALRRSILVIDDEPLLAMDVEMILSDVGYRVVGPAGSGAEALSILREQKPDLTILDLNLGSEMAFSVFDYLEDTGMPFIILSGHSRTTVPERYKDRPFLQKPYQIPSLLQMVGDVLNDFDKTPARQVV